MNIVTRGVGLGQYAGPLVTTGLGRRFSVVDVLTLLFTGPVHRAAFGRSDRAVVFGDQVHGAAFGMLTHTARFVGMVRRAIFGRADRDAEPDDAARRAFFE